MKVVLVLLTIGICVTGVLVALWHYTPATYHIIINYVLRILKGFAYATVQFVKYVQGKPGQTQLSDREMIDSLSSKYTSLQTAYDANLQQLQATQIQLEEKTNEISSYENENAKLRSKSEKQEKEFDRLLDSYNEMKGKLFPVSKSFVSDFFCQEFEQVTSCIEHAEQTLYKMLEREMAEQSNQHLLHYLMVKQQNDVNEFYGWYLTLKYASSLTGAGALDIESYTDYKSQLSYLRRNAFMRYYRPITSALVLCMEQCRTNSRSQQSWAACIKKTIDELSTQNIVVNYIPVGTVYDSSSFDNLIISESPRKDSPVGVVEDVVTIGINSSDLDVPIQETEIIMNL